MKTVKIASLFSVLIFVGLTTAFTPSSDVTPEESLEAGKISFPEFLSHFEKTSMPFKIGLDDQWKYKLPKKSKKTLKTKRKGKGKLSYKLKEYLPLDGIDFYSRMGPSEVLPIARFYPNEKSVAVVYMVYKRFWGLNSGDFQMAIYDLQGNLLNEDKERPAYSKGFELANNSREETQTFEIATDGHITKVKYKNIWQYDHRKKGLKDNQIIAYEKLASETFRINEEGLVQAVKAYPADSRASLD